MYGEQGRFFLEACGWGHKSETESVQEDRNSAFKVRSPAQGGQGAFWGWMFAVRAVGTDDISRTDRDYGVRAESRQVSCSDTRILRCISSCEQFDSAGFCRQGEEDILSSLDAGS